jgi:UDP-3-O-[3-hydroxymyristoyl] glucosamine N-acyltransferase
LGKQRKKTVETIINSSHFKELRLGGIVNVVVNACSSWEKKCNVNTSCIIEHECVLADAVHIGQGAVLANVTISERTFVEPMH